MRLLLATDSYPPFVGGADRQVQMIAHAMRDSGHQVVVATPWQTGLAPREDDDGVEIVRPRAIATRLPGFAKDPRRRHHPPFPDPATTIALWRLVRRFRPDVVHSYGWITYSVSASLLGTRIPLLVSARDYGYVCAIRNYLYYRGRVCSGPALAKCLRCAAHTYTQDDAGNAVLGGEAASVTTANRFRGAVKALASVAGVRMSRPILDRHLEGVHSVSWFVRSVMDRYLIGARQPRSVLRPVIPSFLPPASSGIPEQAVLDRLPREPFILFVGALLPMKGIFPLLRAYERLGRPAPPLVLLGGTFYNSPTVYPEGVLPLGQASHATVMAAWDRALFGVVPSVGAETFGNVATEAMSRGRPVIGSRLGGIVDIIEDGVSGLLVPPGDDHALAAAMRRLLEDPELLERLGEGARERVARFSAARVLPQFEATYAALLDGTESRP